MQDIVVAVPAVIAVLIFGLKKAVGEEFYKKYKRYIPICAIIAGGVISGIFAFAYDLSAQDKVTTILQGFVIGAAAVGYREVVDKMARQQ